jgi:hypothetical protein
MFPDLDESLRQLLMREIPTAANEIDIAFERPDRERTARFSRPTIDLFLFSVDENLELIESGWEITRDPATNGTTMRWPADRVDVRYLVTAWTQAVEDEHSLLYHLYRTFRRFPELPAEVLQGAMTRQPRPIPLGLERGELSPLMDLWNAMDNSVRPSLVVRATVAVDLNDVREIPAVRTSGLRIGPMGRPPETRYSVSGKVRNADGEPISGALVRAGGRTKPVLSAEDGTYSIASISGPRVELSASAPGFEAAVHSIDLPGDYDITLAPQASSRDGSDRPRGRPRGGGA